MAAKQKTSASAGNKDVTSYIAALRQLRFKLRRLWKLPCGFKTTPALFGTILLTMTSLSLTLTGWVMVRLLPNMELIRTLAKDFPNGFWELLRRLPQLLAASQPSTAALGEVLVSQDAYIITYAFGAGTVFCFLLLVVALLRRW